MVASWLPNVTNDIHLSWLLVTSVQCTREAQWKQLELNTSSQSTICLFWAARIQAALFSFARCVLRPAHSTPDSMFCQNIYVAQFISTDRQSFQHMFLPYWSAMFRRLVGTYELLCRIAQQQQQQPNKNCRALNHRQISSVLSFLFRLCRAYKYLRRGCQ